MLVEIDQTAALFALIFIAGDDGIDLQSLSQVTGFDHSAISDLLDDLDQKLAKDKTNPLKLLKNDATYRLITKSDFAALLGRYYQSPIANTLSKASLETLTIIAYKQPVTRVEVDKIRGVNSSGAISRLLSRDLIHGVGRKDEIGRPVIYETTNFFLDYFGLKTITELPKLPDPNTLKNVASTDQTDLFQRPKKNENEN
ncbi:SMC-Scp complex subunit ScpB [Oenococcus sicerae]|uniref:Segregation and condensation protein B n=1 Tax=Oenococcus sicerae TaxID=2203724 RepID=A0AAJ1R9J8_9LACO|nr:SMC-Scp complex subunit ScpB [Oenococcus sicerae]QAS70439.1 SMC-Scp complex subunit ScpB [Oenococcus sicerae]